MRHDSFPFSALTGMDHVKRACLLCLINPACGGLLVSGAGGTGKSTALRSAAALTDDPWVEVPLNTDEDRLFGSLDAEEAVRSGERRILPGLLEKARGGILYLDDVNLFRSDLTEAVTDIAEARRFRLERGDISAEIEVSYTVMAVMNPKEGELPPFLLDGFGLFARTDTVKDAAERADIVRRVLAWEKDAPSFCRQEEEKMQQLAGHVRSARQRLSSVVPGEDMIRLAAAYGGKALVRGHRADLYLIEAARAAAAWDGRSYVLPRDMDEAALYVLPHRMRQLPQSTEDRPPAEENHSPSDESDEDRKPQEQEDSPHEQGDGGEGQMSRTEGEEKESTQKQEGGQEKKRENHSPAGKDRTDRISRRAFCPPAAVDPVKSRSACRRAGGRRNPARTAVKQGRCVRIVPADRGVYDLAFDATLRAAAPYQKRRKHQGCAVVIRHEDLRNQVREKRTGTVFIFAVDASGSMGARERMSMVKGVLFRILCDAYQKRDRVCMIAFRRDRAEILLPATRSMDLAEKCLASLPTGGRTPLAEGLALADRAAGQLMRGDAGCVPSLILVTDGRANAGPEGRDPRQAALEAARRLGQRHMPSAVIDTETGYLRMGIARDAAEAMGGAYYSMDHLSEERLFRIVRKTKEAADYTAGSILGQKK